MWNKFLACMLGVLLLASCASTSKPLSYRQHLDRYKDMKIRFYKIANPLRIAAAEFCQTTEIDTGIAYHRLSDYPEKMQVVANGYWGLGEDDTILFQQNPSHKAICHMPIELEYEKHVNAWTDGESVFATPLLLHKVDDLTLALIIAHELGHNVLNHADGDMSDRQAKLDERAADRFAMFMMARAGLDYRQVATLEAASRRPHSISTSKYTRTNDRAAHFSKIVLEIERLQTDGKALVP